MVAEEQSANVDEMNVVYNDDSDQNLAFIDRFEYTDEYQVDQILKASKLMKTFTKKALDGKNIGALRRAYKQHLTAAAKIKRVLAKIGSQISNFDESDSDEVDAVMQLIGDKALSTSANMFNENAWRVVSNKFHLISMTAHWNYNTIFNNC